jgi:two-component system sensor histidine kinase BaeS
MAVITAVLFQSPWLSLPVSVLLTAVVGLLLLAMAAGGLLALRLRPIPPPSLPFADLLNGLPLPGALVDSHGRLVSANPEAAPWLNPAASTRLTAPLEALARRVAVNQQTETTAIILQEGQPPLRIQATPLRSNRLVLIIGQPASGSTNPHLSRLMAHELRTPLTAIVGHTGILAGCTPADEALWRRSRDFIAAEAARLARLVEDWLTLSRLDAAPPLTRPVNLRRLAENTLAAQFDRAEAAGLTLTLQSPPTLPRVCADPDRIEQALGNLVDNAIKYTPAGGAVSLQLASEGGYVRVQVSDTGPGITPDDLPHLFEPLYRADSARRLSGAGLGLTIVRAILDQHGASISIHSPPGQGAAFTFRLPAAR